MCFKGLVLSGKYLLNIKKYVSIKIKEKRKTNLYRKELVVNLVQMWEEDLVKK